MQPFQIRIDSQRKEFAPVGANSFLCELTPEMGDKNENELPPLKVNVYAFRESTSFSFLFLHDGQHLKEK